MKIEMRKRWFILAILALVMIVQLALPGVAFAGAPTKFTSSGEITDIQFQDIQPVGPYLLLYPENSEGIITDEGTGLAALEDAELVIAHTSLDNSRNATGVMSGTFNLENEVEDPITRNSETALIIGTMQAVQTSSYTVDGNLRVESRGTWHATVREGEFLKIAPNGKWQSTLEVEVTVPDPYDPNTWEFDFIGGTFIWEGKCY